jgi:hypothetical protein
MGYDKTEKKMRLMAGWVREQLYAGGSSSDDESIGHNIETEYVASLYWVFTTLTTLGYGDFYG